MSKASGYVGRRSLLSRSSAAKARAYSGIVFDRRGSRIISVGEAIKGSKKALSFRISTKSGEVKTYTGKQVLRMAKAYKKAASKAMRTGKAVK